MLFEKPWFARDFNSHCAPVDFLRDYMRTIAMPTYTTYEKLNVYDFQFMVVRDVCDYIGIALPFKSFIFGILSVPPSYHVTYNFVHFDLCLNIASGRDFFLRFLYVSLFSLCTFESHSFLSLTTLSFSLNQL